MNRKAKKSNDSKILKTGDILTDDLGLLFMKMTSEFHRMQEEKARDFYSAGLRPSHAAVLYYVAERPHRLSELSVLNRMRPQSMVKLVNELEGLGYVERVPDPSDSRAKLIQFTAKGKKVSAISGSATREIYRIYAEILGEKDLRHMLSTMNKLLVALDARAPGGTWYE